MELLTEGPYEEIKLTVSTPTSSIVRAMAAPDSGLEIRDRMWLKITIPNAFIGADVVDWLFQRVEGFSERRDARKYASQLLKNGYIRHTVNKKDFSEQCYYVFGDICSSFAGLKLGEEDNLSEADRDTLGPLPPPSATSPWTGLNMPYAGTYIPPVSGFAPMPFNYSNESYTFNRDGSTNSGSGGSSSGTQKKIDRKSASPAHSGSDSEVASQLSARRIINTTTSNTGGGSGSSASTNVIGSVIGINGAADRGGSSGSERSSATSGSQMQKIPINQAPLPPPKPLMVSNSPNGVQHFHSMNSALHQLNSSVPYFVSPPIHNVHPYNQNACPSSSSAPMPFPSTTSMQQTSSQSQHMHNFPQNNSSQHQLGRPLNNDLSSSTNSFNMAMSNPCNFFVDSV